MSIITVADGLREWKKSSACQNNPRLFNNLRSALKRYILPELDWEYFDSQEDLEFNLSRIPVQMFLVNAHEIVQIFSLPLDSISQTQIRDQIEKVKLNTLQSYLRTTRKFLEFLHQQNNYEDVEKFLAPNKDDLEQYIPPQNTSQSDSVEQKNTSRKDSGNSKVTGLSRSLMTKGNSYGWANNVISAAIAVAKWDQAQKLTRTKEFRIEVLQEYSQIVRELYEKQKKEISSEVISFPRMLEIINYLRQGCCKYHINAIERSETAQMKSWQRYLIIALLIYTPLTVVEIRHLQIDENIEYSDGRYLIKKTSQNINSVV